MRIDAHVHGRLDHLAGDPGAYVDACRNRGVEAVVLIESLETCLKAVDIFGDFIIPVARVAMDASGVREIEACIEAGCRGIKFIRPAAPYGDARYWPMYAALGVTSVFHTGYLGFQGRKDDVLCFEPYIAFYERIFDAINLPAAMRERVNRGNARYLFGLDAV